MITRRKNKMLRETKKKVELLEEVLKKVDNSIGKELNLNRNKDEYHNIKAEDDKYINLDNFKKVSGNTNKTVGSTMIEAIERKEDIKISRFLYLLLGVCYARYIGIMGTSLTYRYISRKEAESIGYFLGCNGIDLFKNVMYETNSITSLKRDYADRYKINTDLILNIKHKREIKNYLGINDRFFNLLEIGGIYMNKYAAYYAVRVISYFDYLNLTDDEIYNKMIIETTKSDIKPNVNVTPLTMQLVNRKKEIIDEVEISTPTRSSVLNNLLNNLSDAENLLSVEDLDYIIEYITEMKNLKVSKDKLLKQKEKLLNLEDKPQKVEISKIELQEVKSPVIDTVSEVKDTKYLETKNAIPVISTKTFLEVPNQKSESEEDIVVEMYKEGDTSIKECADLLDISTMQFRKLLDEKGVVVTKTKSNNKKFDEKFQSEFWLFVNGKKLACECAKELGIANSTFCVKSNQYKKILADEGIKVDQKYLNKTRTIGKTYDDKFKKLFWNYINSEKTAQECANELKLKERTFLARVYSYRKTIKTDGISVKRTNNQRKFYDSAEFQTVFNLYADGKITAKNAAKRLNITQAQFSNRVYYYKNNLLVK